MGWLTHILGLDDGSGRWYLWWSGMGANIGEIAIVGSLASGVRHRTPWRPARPATAHTRGRAHEESSRTDDRD